MTSIRELLKWDSRWIITKYRVDERIRREFEQSLHEDGLDLREAEETFNIKPYEVLSFKGNILLNEGINTLWTLVCGGSATAYDNTNAHIGVGDGTASEDATQTGLQGTNKAWKGMDSGYPTYGSDQKATWRATFGGDEANFDWNEITVVNASDDSGENLNRKVQAMGTKSSGATWVATLEITLS